MKRTIFIGQAMPRIKNHPHHWPSLNSWLYSIGVSVELIKKYFHYSALVDYFPGTSGGGHKVPTKNEIEKERERLVKTLKSFDPEIVVPVGKKSISYCLSLNFNLLSEVVGKTYSTDPYQALNKRLTIVPLPHPSGASTWYNKRGNKKLLDKALSLLKKELNI